MSSVLPALEPWTDICCYCWSSTLLFALVPKSPLSEVSPYWTGLPSGPLVLLGSSFSRRTRRTSRYGEPAVRFHDHLPGTYLDTSLTCHPTSSSPCWMFLEVERQLISSWELSLGLSGVSVFSHHLHLIWWPALFHNLALDPEGLWWHLPSLSECLLYSSLSLQKHSSLPPEERAAQQAAARMTLELKSQICLETSMWELSLLKNHHSDEGGLQKHMSFEPVSVSGKHTQNILRTLIKWLVISLILSLRGTLFSWLYAKIIFFLISKHLGQCI